MVNWSIGQLDNWIIGQLVKIGQNEQNEQNEHHGQNEPETCN